MKRILLAVLAALGINFGVKSQTEKLDSGLRNTLKLVADRFEKDNHAYLINLAKDNSVIIQIVHGALIQQTSTPKNEFNFSLNLTFDNQIDELNSFRELKIASEFINYEWDGIPCFAVNFGNNLEKANRIVLEVLQKVYGFKPDDIFEFEIYDQGKIRI
ncbi:hypothetical protein [Aquimarina brevivitae]|uniref:Uncharacterized protein n=1 Tax=Aquimarina brevivitae TaxID=323412 RepID=A0A4Q7NWZ2_9FLAO|nr:hypothetical protein [Aquimarina brevivitae]RZS91863.1 hypothetical protein EV197_2966 [Aquimarina brevivitae]